MIFFNLFNHLKRNKIHKKLQNYLKTNPQSKMNDDNNTKTKAIKIMFLICGILLVATLYTAYYRYDKIKHAIKTTGKIIGFREEVSEKRENNRTTKTTFYYPKYQFKNESGSIVTVQSNVGTGNSPSYELDEEIKVMYDPNDNQDAQIDSFFNLWLFTIILGGLTLCFTFITFVIKKSSYNF